MTRIRRLWNGNGVELPAPGPDVREDAIEEPVCDAGVCESTAIAPPEEPAPATGVCENAAGSVSDLDTSEAPAEAETDPVKHHIIISGTGRAGTTFLVKLMTGLGMDTGFAPDGMTTWPASHAGLEWDIRAPDAPYVVKNPWICNYIDEILANPRIHIDHAIIPMRALEAAAESRRHVERITDPEGCQGLQEKPGGLWLTADPSGQEHVLARLEHALLTALAKTDAEVILVNYPKLTRDPDYLFQKLSPLLSPTITKEDFADVFWNTVDPKLVHQFTADDC